VAVVRTGPVRGSAGGAAGGAARGAAGTVLEQRAQGALRPARAQRADSRGDASENKKANAARHDEHTKQGGHPKQHGRQRRAGGGTAPPRCLDNCANNTCYNNSTSQRQCAVRSASTGTGTRVDSRQSTVDSVATAS